MPTYEYACMSCGNHVEVYQRFSDAPLTECGVCGGPLRKVFHPAGILFKGSGFYATDSRASKGGGSKDGDRESSTPAPAPSASKGGEGTGASGESAKTSPSSGSSAKEKSA